jgi:hypothetical protein
LSHQVFIERCRDSDPKAAESLARAIASRYGVDPKQILGRLGTGRFRVKANLDLASARRFMEYLESEGALCTIVDDGGDIVARSAQVTPTPPADAGPDDFLPLYTPPPGQGPGMQYESGLAAGFTGASDSQDLGVLADAAAASSGSLKLSMLDGGNSEAKGGPSAGSVADVSDVEAFLPPEMLKEVKLELADEPEAEPDMPEYEAPVHTPAPQGFSEPATDDPLESVGQVSQHSAKRSIAPLLVSARGRLTLGVLLAFVVGFLISSTVASGMEEGQYSKAHTELESVYAEVDSVETWLELDEVRKTTLDSLERRRKNIVITSLLVWLVTGGLLLFLWLRVVNWERIERSVVENAS